MVSRAWRPSRCTSSRTIDVEGWRAVDRPRRAALRDAFGADADDVVVLSVARLAPERLSPSPTRSRRRTTRGSCSSSRRRPERERLQNLADVRASASYCGELE
jgi:hypothetical protein